MTVVTQKLRVYVPIYIKQKLVLAKKKKSTVTISVLNKRSG